MCLILFAFDAACGVSAVSGRIANISSILFSKDLMGFLLTTNLTSVNVVNAVRQVAASSEPESYATLDEVLTLESV